MSSTTGARAPERSYAPFRICSFPPYAHFPYMRNFAIPTINKLIKHQL